MTVTLNRRQILTGLASGTVVALTGCAENPALGRRQLMLVSDEQLSEMSALTWQRMLQEKRLSRDSGDNRRVQRVGERIVSTPNAPPRDWKFAVIDSNEVNAFVLPNGQVAFYSGILDMFQNDDQLATVMGHEVGHIAGRHSAERASQAMAANIGLQLTSIALASQNVPMANEIAGVLGAGVTFGVLLPYSRRHEYEADRLGVMAMNAARYNPQEAVRFWDRFAARSQNTPDFFSTHPSDASRVAALRDVVRTLA